MVDTSKKDFIKVKKQSEKEVEVRSKRKYVFRHKHTFEIEGTDKLDVARGLCVSPSWECHNDAAKALQKKELPKVKAKNKAREPKVAAE